MNCDRKQINAFKTTMYEQVKGKVVHMPNWQRTYDWSPIEADEMIQDILRTASTIGPKSTNTTYLGRAIIHNVGSSEVVVADGHTRIVTFGIILKALLDVCSERGFNIGSPAGFTVQYDLDIARGEYLKYVKAPTGATKYAKVYVYACECLNQYISTKDDALNVLEAMVAYVDISIESCATIDLAHKSFVQENAGGKTLNEVEVISSFLQRYMDIYKVDLDYDYKELDDLLEGYYFCKSAHIAPAFNVGTIRRFMEDCVVDTRASLLEFKKYLDAVNEFKNTNWYKLLKILGKKSIMVGYVMAARSYKMDGSDADVNAFMTSLVVFDIASYAHGSNTGGASSGQFDKVKRLIGCGTDISDVNELFIKWAGENQNAYGNPFALFSRSLDSMDEKYQKALLWFVYMMSNKNSLPTDVELEHVYPRDPSIVWFKFGWPKKSAAQTRMVECLGNKILLDKTYNKMVHNAYLTDKEVMYDEFFTVNAAYKYSANYFDCTRFAKEKQAYLDERRDAYAKILADTDMGKALVC